MLQIVLYGFNVRVSKNGMFIFRLRHDIENFIGNILHWEPVDHLKQLVPVDVLIAARVQDDVRAKEAAREIAELMRRRLLLPQV